MPATRRTARTPPAVRVPAPLPCPCCGAGRRRLEVGRLSGDTYGVRCRGCGLRLPEPLPDGWPDGVAGEGLGGQANLDRLYAWTTARAVARWNRRVTAPPGKSRP